MISFDNYQPETERLKFIYDRDGYDGVVDFAKRTMKIYRQAVIRHDGFARSKRKLYIQSYLAFKQFLYDQNQLG